MAAVVITRNYLINVIGLGNDDRANAVMAQGVTDLDSLAEFGEDDIKTLCSAVRKPGGTIQVGGAQVPNPGHNIAAICETKLINAAYGANLYRMIGRPITPNSLSVRRLTQLRKHKHTIDKHSDNDPKIPTVSKSYGIMKAIDAFPSILRETLGVNDVALSYVIREVAVPGAPPPLAANVPWSDEYTCLMDELIAYAPHSGPGYADDNATVLRLLEEMLKDTSHLTSLKPYIRARNGRGAFAALQLHNMGESKWDKIIEAAEDMVQSRTWNGRNARYPLRAHITRHREAHNDFIRASQHVQYVPPNEHTRVSRLLKSITSSDPSIAAAKTTILADANKRDNFEQASDFILLAAPQKPRGGENNHNISSVQQDAGERKRKGKVQTGATGVEFRYYKKGEFAKLSQEQKKELKEYREKQKKNKKENQQKIAALESKLEEQAQIIATLRTPALPPAPPANPAPAPPANPLQPPTGFNQRQQH